MCYRTGRLHSHGSISHSYTRYTFLHGNYLQTFDRTKDILLEFRTSKATCAQANRQDQELRELMADQRAKEVHQGTVTNRRRLADQGRVERSDRQIW